MGGFSIPQGDTKRLLPTPHQRQVVPFHRPKRRKFTEISPEDVARIRRLLPARLRAAVLLRLAEMAEREPESFKRALEGLGVTI